MTAPGPATYGPSQHPSANGNIEESKGASEATPMDVDQDNAAKGQTISTNLRDVLARSNATEQSERHAVISVDNQEYKELCGWLAEDAHQFLLARQSGHFVAKKTLGREMPLRTGVSITKDPFFSLAGKEHNQYRYRLNFRENACYDTGFEPYLQQVRGQLKKTNLRSISHDEAICRFVFAMRYLEPFLKARKSSTMHCEVDLVHAP